MVCAYLVQVSQLHPVAPEFSCNDAGADVAVTSQLNKLKPISREQDREQQQPWDEACDLPLAFCWSSVLWTRALQHKNLQVGWQPLSHTHTQSLWMNPPVPCTS